MPVVPIQSQDSLLAKLMQMFSTAPQTGYYQPPQMVDFAAGTNFNPMSGQLDPMTMLTVLGRVMDMPGRAVRQTAFGTPEFRGGGFVGDLVKNTATDPTLLKSLMMGVMMGGLKQVGKSVAREAGDEVDKSGVKQAVKKFLVQRIEEPGVVTDLNKPHGVYTTPADVVSPHADLGGERSLFEWNAKKPLDVSGPLDVQHARFGRYIQGSASAGIKALKALVPEEFDSLLKASKEQLASLFRLKFPKVDWNRYYDSYEMLEAYAAQRARQAGYDAIIDKSVDAPEFAEYVALSPKALTPVKAH